jgi:hypothetical protein
VQTGKVADVSEALHLRKLGSYLSVDTVLQTRRLGNALQFNKLTNQMQEFHKFILLLPGAELPS